MKIVNRTVECGWYEIANHIDAERDPNDPTVLKCEPLWCRIDPEHLSKRDKTRKTNEDLLSSFESACLGENPRWRLVRIDITDEAHVQFIFGDAEAVVRTGNEKRYQCILFPKFDGTFSVRVHRPGSTIPDEYYFEFWNSDEFDEQGQRLVVNIEEERNGRWYALESINQHKDGKYYLTQHLYDL